MAVFFLVAGTLKIAGIEPVRERAAALNLSFEQYCLFGVAEVPTGVALIIGLGLPAVARAAALFLTLLMMVLITVHVRAGSPPGRLAPPIALWVAATALTLLLFAS